MPSIEHILCPIDFSEVSAHAVSQAVVIAGLYAARISALHVCPPTTMPVPAVPLPETEDQADLIVLGVHGRRAIDILLLGSTTNQVVRHATCPVLTLRR
jgi:nucleotide-binding universal stress UspA family protein